MLYNLIGNALKFTFSGHIEIHVSLADTNILKTDISDTGIGIKDSDKYRLFNFFGKLETSK